MGQVVRGVVTKVRRMTGTGGDITVTREMGVELASDRVGVEAVDKDRVD